MGRKSYLRFTHFTVMKKMKNAGLLLLVAVITVLSSCQKEASFEEGDPDPGNGGGGGGGGNNNASIVGNYKLVYESVYEKAVLEDNTGGFNTKLIIEGLYTLKNITGGDVQFTNTQFISNFGYTIDTTINSKMYIDGVLLSDQDLPIFTTAPPTTTTMGYVRNNADSLTMDAPPSVPNIPGGGPAPAIGPMGMRISWSGDTLILKSKLQFTAVTTGPVAVTANTVMKLKKI
jgi:hypothetical protein